MVTQFIVRSLHGDLSPVKEIAESGRAEQLINLLQCGNLMLMAPSQLPIELIEEIIEHYALLNPGKALLSLQLTSRLFKVLTEPHSLYSVALKSWESISKFHTHLQALRRRQGENGVLGNRVLRPIQHLFISTPWAVRCCAKSLPSPVPNAEEKIYDILRFAAPTVRSLALVNLQISHSQSPETYSPSPVYDYPALCELTLYMQDVFSWLYWDTDKETFYPIKVKCLERVVETGYDFERDVPWDATWTAWYGVTHCRFIMVRGSEEEEKELQEPKIARRVDFPELQNDLKVVVFDMPPRPPDEKKEDFQSCIEEYQGWIEGRAGGRVVIPHSEDEESGVVEKLLSAWTSRSLGGEGFWGREWRPYSKKVLEA